MEGITIRLTDTEMCMAAVAGAMRQKESVDQGRVDRFRNTDKSGLEMHIDGAYGELAFCKWAGRYWGGERNTFSDPDVGSNIQIRTRSRHNYDLLVRPDAKDHHCYVHITGVAPILVLRGWMWARDAKQERWLKPHGDMAKAYFVPVEFLRPMVKAAA
jgi:hypothetical protein